MRRASAGGTETEPSSSWRVSKFNGPLIMHTLRSLTPLAVSGQAANTIRPFGRSIDLATHSSCLHDAPCGLNGRPSLRNDTLAHREIIFIIIIICPIASRGQARFLPLLSDCLLASCTAT